MAPVELPIGHESDFHGVIDLLDDTATHYDTQAAGTAVDGTVPPAGHEGPIPDDLVDEEHTVHEQLVEGVVVGDDDLMERYLNGETLDYTELEKSLAGGVASASVRSKSARSRSSLLMTITRGTPSRAAARQASSVWACTPSVALTTSTARSTLASAVTISPAKSA